MLRRLKHLWSSPGVSSVASVGHGLERIEYDYIIQKLLRIYSFSNVSVALRILQLCTLKITLRLQHEINSRSFNLIAHSYSSHGENSGNFSRYF